MEQAILGACIVSTSSAQFAAEMLRTEDFHRTEHRLVFEAIRGLLESGQPVELLTLQNRLIANEAIERVGGVPFLLRLTNAFGSEANAEHYARIVAEKSLRRSMLEAARQAAWLAHDEDVPAEELPRRSAALFELAPRLSSRVPAALRLSDLRPEKVSWLWPGRLPYGKLTILDGDPGLGKSCIGFDLAARLTTGQRTPTGETLREAPVIVCSAEDGLADTILPRVLGAGGDPSRVFVPQLANSRSQERLPVLPDDVVALERLAEKTGARLLLLDPLFAFLSGSLKSFVDQDVRAALTPLARMAERTGVAVLVIRHLRKQSGAAIYAGGGSIGITGAARSVLMAGRDPRDADRRVIASVKSNLCAPAAPLGYRMIPSPDGLTVRIEWLGEVEGVTADDLAAPSGGRDEDRDTAEECAEWLRHTLQEGPQPSLAVEEAARAKGFSRAQLARARARLGARAFRVGGAGASGSWRIAIG